MRVEAESQGRHLTTAQDQNTKPINQISLRFASALQGWVDYLAPSPWGAHTGCRSNNKLARVRAQANLPVYTPEQRRRRDQTPWTMVQGVLAPLQFIVFLVSLGLVIRYLATGAGYELATISVVAKTLILYAIMITGSIWEKVVFGRWLFADAFFWEDVFSMLVLALHTAYLATVFFGWGTADQQMMLALAAYLTYVINAVQFLWKLRLARMEAPA